MTIDVLEQSNYPAICTPLTGKTKATIMEQLDEVLTQVPDVIEWRADFLQELANTDHVLEIIYEIKETTTIPLLFTIRAEHEGGTKTSLSESEIAALLKVVCQKTTVDLIDYETSNEPSSVKEVQVVAKKTGKILILSHHNFYMTPSNSDLLERAQQVEDLGGDIAKFAVMPQSKEDVLRLLEMTKVIDETLDIPVITMSMGDIGGLSRIVGWAYGSVLTFGVGVELSAPGQMPVTKLRESIQSMQNLVPSWK